MMADRVIAGSAESSAAGPAPEGLPADRDERLAELIDGLAQQLRAGQRPDVEAVARRHVDLAEELRSLWGAMLVADCVARRAGDEPTAVHTPGPPTSLAHEVPADGRTFGDYQLLDELGQGGMGVVYRARQISLDRIVALKMILGGHLAGSADLARFRAEAESAARLDHPGIVPVYEVGFEAGQPFFTMKYVAGTTLAERLAEGPMPAREAAALLAPVCRAVAFAHGRGVLHRDLKPANILIDIDGRPHVSDFGLAKRIETDANLTHSGAILGTPSYMAPEQAAGRGVLGPTCDVYSLGTILYQMLTGRPPFQAASPVDTVLLLLEQEPLPPRLINPRADRELEMIALRCLQKPPELRYADAGSLADDLEAFLADEPTTARSGHFGQIVARAFRETHHATVLENWGLLWMWHSLVLLAVCLLTNLLQSRGVTGPWPYLGLWIAGLGTWAGIFWTLRRRSGPVTFVERQIAHVWAGSMVSIAGLFGVEMMLGLPVLSLSPVLGLVSSMVFLVKAGMLSGQFYVQAVALWFTAIAMALMQRYDIPGNITLFGVVSAACFFVPGLKYYRQRITRRG
ncbi:MAG TPA: serine/threonine-protein kinase [Pirellulales bacterium]|jgi:serine/threonine-protein kinase|nr:serine/threonine-protein kinase [Pirellulales bacterium]